MCWIASVYCCTAENCWAKPSTVSPNSPAWEMGASRKRALSTSFISTRLSQKWRSWTTMVDIAFPRDRAVTFVARRAKSPRVGTTLVHLFECLGLVNLQDSHGVQGGGCLARSAISCGRESGCQLTGLGRETRTVPPSGGVSWAQVYRNRSLHLGNAHVPQGHSAVEGSEDGGGGRGASGRERGHPRPRQLLMHLREERHRGRARLDSADRTVMPTGNKTKMNGFVEISTLLIHSAPKQKSNEWMHLSPFRMHGEWLRYAKSTSQFHWRFLLVRDVRGFQVNPLCRHDITRSDRQIGNQGYICNILNKARIKGMLRVNVYSLIN